jgi:hypothetical protein
MVLSRLEHPTRAALLVVVVLWAIAAAAWAQDRKPLPEAAAQKRALGLLHDVYGKEYEAAETSKEKTELAKKLLDQAAKTEADPASHFVLLRVAKDVAVLAADAETAMEAYIEWSGPQEALSEDGFWRMGAQTLGLGTNSCRVVFHSVRVRDIAPPE